MQAANLAISQLNEKQHMQVDEPKSWFWNIVPWGAKAPISEEEKLRRQREFEQQRTSSRIKLERAKRSLLQAEQDHASLLARQKKLRADEIRVREEKLREQRAENRRENDEKMRKEAEERAAKNAARARTEAAERAATQEAIHRRQEAERRARDDALKAAKAARQNARRMAAQQAADWQREEAERRERDQREVIHRKIRNQSGTTGDSSPRQSDATTHDRPIPSMGSHGQRNAHRNTHPRKQQRSRSTTQPEPATRMCLHKNFWPKVQGRHECNVCLVTFPNFILQCPHCQLMACASCKRQTKASGR